jgi:hypothetical protein
MKKLNLLLLLIIVSVISSYVNAQILYVPSQYGSIQAAVNAANAGDTIDILGTFTESDIQIQKPLFLRGHGPDSTIVQGGTSLANSTGGVFYITRSYYYSTTDVYLYGMTIRFGSQTTTPWCYGGGIYNTADLYIDNCIITDNECKKGTWNGGGGIKNENNLFLKNSIIKNNTVKDSSYSLGGGIHNNGLMHIDSCIIKNNTCDSGKWCYGGGIKNDETLYIKNSTVLNNTVANGLWLSGGGLKAESRSETYIEGCNFEGNNINLNSYTWKWGSAISSKGNMEILNTTFFNNSGSSVIDHDTYRDDTLHISHSTIYGNSEGLFCDDGTVIIKNSISWNSGYDDRYNNGRGIIISQGYNVVKDTNSTIYTHQTDTCGINPNVISYDYHGAFTKSFSIGMFSVAYKRGINTDTKNRLVNTDQRNLQRGIICDIGAFESYPVMANAIQSPNYACVGASRVLMMKIVVSDINPGLDYLTEMAFSPLAGTNSNDTRDLRLFYTGNSDFFNPNIVVDNYQNLLDANYDFKDSMSLYNGLNYFWLVGDLTDSAVGSDIIDFKLDSLKINNSSVQIGVQSPPAEITVQSAPEILSDLQDTFVCQGTGMVTFSALANSTGPLNYSWTYNNTTLNRQSLSISSYNPDSLLVKLSVSNCCSSVATDSFMFIIGAKPQTPKIDVSPNDSVCMGDSIVVTAPNSHAYLWSNNETSQSLTIWSDTILRLQVSGTNGCVSDYCNKTKLSFISLPVKPKVSSILDTFVCVGGLYIFSVNQTETSYLWSDNTTSRYKKIRDTNTYWVQTFNKLGCASPKSDPVRIYFHPQPKKPILTLSGNNSICFGDTVLISGPSGYKFYNWNHPEIDSRSIKVANTGTYHLVVVDSNNCYSESSDTIKITRFPLSPAPVINVDGSTKLCDGETTILKTDDNALGYNWSNGSDTKEIFVDTGGIYYLTITDSNNCLSGKSNSVKVDWYPRPEKPILNITGDSTNCVGEIVDIYPQQQYANYLWSNVEHSQKISITSEGSYSLSVGNVHNCYSDFSDAANIYFDPVPQKPIITKLGDSLYCNRVASHYFWYRNETLLNTDSKSIKADVTGVYKVQIMNSVCFSEFSDDLVYLPDNIEQNQTNNYQLEVYPNPGRDKFYIDINETINESLNNISVLDLNGKILSSAKTVILNDKIEINLQNQPKGIYMVRLVFDGEVVSLRVVKE